VLPVHSLSSKPAYFRNSWTNRSHPISGTVP
jgi:hypothetical protein